VLTSRTADAHTGATLFFKCENLQRTGAFKFRGAYNAIARLPDDARRRGIVTFSSGNHAQAIACAAKLLETPATIVMPRDAPVIKVAATRGYGGEILFYDRATEDREAIGRRLAEKRGLALIPPYDHPDVIAGQGTAAKESFEDAGPLDLLLVPLGGGGLLAGSALAAGALSPGCRVIGVEPEAGDDFVRSLAAGERVRIPVPRTIDDGQQLPMPGELTFEVISERVDDVVLASDAEIVEAMRVLFERVKTVAEPSGASALAALLAGRLDARGLRVGVTISGGNVTAERFAALVG
jgi:threo-3-hydroxy-L-aspartate ammonia-lyase